MGISPHPHHRRSFHGLVLELCNSIYHPVLLSSVYGAYDLSSSYDSDVLTAQTGQSRRFLPLLTIAGASRDDLWGCMTQCKVSRKTKNADRAQEDHRRSVELQFD